MRSFITIILIAILVIIAITTILGFMKPPAVLPTSLIPPLRRTYAPEPAIYEHIGDGKCSKREFFLTVDNVHEAKQINLFYSRGDNDDRLALSSAAPKARLYQCCPHYDVGVKLYYKFHNENKWYKYPHTLDRKYLDSHSNLIAIQSTDFEESQTMV